MLTILISLSIGTFIGWKAKKKQVEIKEKLQLTGKF
jgi:hypothetical protein